MKKEELMEAIGMIDDLYLLQAQTYRDTTQISHKKIYAAWLKTAIACIVVLFVSINVFYTNGLIQEQSVDQPSISQTSKLPTITLNDLASDSFGYPIEQCLSPSDFVNGNPWNETLSISSLPVFQNNLTYDAQYRVSGYSIDNMKKELFNVADRLNIPSEQLQIQMDCTPYYAFIQTENETCEISVDHALRTQITFKNGILLPKDLQSLSLNNYENNLKIAEYIQTAYADLINMQNPQIDVNGGGCDIYGDRMYNISFYDKGETTEESILNYNFRTVDFFVEDGRLLIVTFHHTDLSSYIANYPIISVDEATELLQKGNYLTSIPAGLIKDDASIAKVELIYRHDEPAQYSPDHLVYFAPYYCFTIEVKKEAQAEGATSYGNYYVPAISKEYIDTMPLNGSIPTTNKK